MVVLKPRCTFPRKDGQPCKAYSLNGHDYCVVHAPENEQLRRERSAKGGRNRSNAARAWREFEKVDRDATVKDLMPILFRAMRKVGTYELSPAVMNSMAAGARAIVAVAGVADLDERIAALEAAIAETTGQDVQQQIRRVK